MTQPSLDTTIVLPTTSTDPTKPDVWGSMVNTAVGKLQVGLRNLNDWLAGKFDPTTGLIRSTALPFGSTTGTVGSGADVATALSNSAAAVAAAAAAGSTPGNPGADGAPGANGRDGAGIIVTLFTASLPAGTAANQAWFTYSQEAQAAGVASTDVFTQTGHGLTSGQTIALTVDGPAPLVAGVLGSANAGTFYYVILVDANTFKLSATVSGGTPGSAVNITADGTLKYVQ